MKQKWIEGNRVKVGFLTLTVVKSVSDGYVLKSDKGKLYHFEPYHGLICISLEQFNNYLRKVV